MLSEPSLPPDDATLASPSAAHAAAAAAAAPPQPGAAFVSPPRGLSESGELAHDTAAAPQPFVAPPRRALPFMSTAPDEVMDDGESEDEDEDDVEMQQLETKARGNDKSHALQFRALFCLPGDSLLRKWLYWLTHRREFEAIVQLMIFANCVFLAMHNPCAASQDRFLDVVELFFIGFFSMEVCVKVVAHGFLLHPHSYLRNWWNVLDFFIVVTAWVASLPHASNYSSMRALRALRPLRSINSIPGLKLIVTSLFLSVRGLLHVLSLVLFFFLVFGILGVQLFKGLFRMRCIDNATQVPPPGEEEVFCKDGGAAGGFLGRSCPDTLVCGEYQNPSRGFVHFDNIGTAWLVVFQCITLEGWVDQMYRVQDVWGQLAPLYFIPLVILGSFFLLNLALAVIFEKFASAKERSIDVRLQEMIAAAEDQIQDQLNDQMQRSGRASEPAIFAVAPAGDLEQLAAATGALVGPADASSSDNTANPPAPPARSSISASTCEDGVTAPKPLRRVTLADGLIRGITADSADFVPHRRASTAASSEAVEDSTRAATRAGTRQSLRKEALLRRLSMPEDVRLMRLAAPRRSTIFTTSTGLDLRSSAARRRVQQLTDSSAFQWTVLGFIVVNTILLAMEHHGQPERLTDFLTVANYVFIGIFAGEMLLKIFAMGLRNYVRDSFNALDGAVVVVSFIELPLSGESFVSVFRALRLLRVFKLMKNFPSLRNLVRVILKAVAETGYLTMVILLYLFVAALVGMRLFGCKFKASTLGEDPRATFDGFGWSMLTVFQILTRDDWVEPMWNAMATTHPISAIYFVALVILGDFLFLNLFLAILISSFDRYMNGPDSTNDGDSSDEDEAEHAFREALAKFNDGSGGIRRKDGPERLSISSTGIQRRPVLEKSATSTSVAPDPLILGLIANRRADNGDACEDAQGSVASREEVPAETAVRNCRGSAWGCSSTTPTPVPLPGSAQELFAVDPIELSPPRRDPSASPPRASHASSQRPAKAQPVVGLGAVATSRKALEYWTHLPETTKGSSLGIFKPNTHFRRWLTYFVTHRYFENMILFAILVSSVVLAIENPRAERNGVIDGLNFFFSILFTVELFLKVLAFGFVAHPGAYLRDGWNVLDAFVVCISVLSLVFSSFAVLKVLRALRPLRVVNRNTGLKLVVRTLLQSLPAVANVALIAMLIYLIFGILGVQLFAGKLQHCEDPSNEDAKYTLSTKAECENTTEGNHSRRWVTNEQNFDNIGVSLLTLFEVSTLELWSTIMYTVIDNNGVDKGPARDQNPWVPGFYFTVFIVIGSFFVMNLFVGVIIWSYSVEKAALDAAGEGDALLTEEQEEWSKMLRFLLTFRPKVRMLTGRERRGARIPPQRRAVCRLASSPHLEVVVMTTIMANVAVMALEHNNMDSNLNTALSVVHNFCSGVFIAEAAIKVSAWRVEYFLDAWNRFDFFLVVLAVLGLFFLFLNANAPVDPTVLLVFRVFRVARMVRLVRSSRGTRVLIETLWYSVPYLSNIGVLLLLLFFIYATLGYHLFHDIQHSTYLNYHANFDNWGKAVLVLFRVSTGENWNGIMHNLMESTRCETTEFPGKCTPHPVLPPLFFVTFILIASQVLLNLFVAIILDNFATTIMFERSPLCLNDINNFQQAWSYFDPDATLTVPTTVLPQLLTMIGAPLGMDRIENRQSLLIFLQRAGILDHGGVMHYVEVLIPLCRAAMKIQQTEAGYRHEEKTWVDFFPSVVLLPDCRYRRRRLTADQFFGATFIAAAYRRSKAVRKLDGMLRERRERREMWARHAQQLASPQTPIQLGGASSAVLHSPTGVMQFGSRRCSPTKAARTSQVTPASGRSAPEVWAPDSDVGVEGGADADPESVRTPVLPAAQTPDVVVPFVVANSPSGWTAQKAGSPSADSGAGDDTPHPAPDDPKEAAGAEGDSECVVHQQVVHTHHHTTIINNNYFIYSDKERTVDATAAAAAAAPAAAAADGPADDSTLQ